MARLGPIMQWKSMKGLIGEGEKKKFGAAMSFPPLGGETKSEKRGGERRREEERKEKEHQGTLLSLCMLMIFHLHFVLEMIF